MAPNTTPTISDNYNENSSDPNPYAYPYFHADGTAPLIYELIVTHFGSEGERPSAESGACTRVVTNRRGILARAIQSQCIARPLEASWTDSCGENSLHRLCQLVHFPLHERIHGVSLPNTDTTNHQSVSNKKISHSKQKKNLNAAELFLLVQNFVLEADSKAADALNNWGETPLHQFLSHCGFASKQTDDVDAINEILDEGTLFKLHFGCRDSEIETGVKDKGERISPVLQFLDALLEANPDMIYTANYLKALPLHEACTLSQLSNSPTDLSAPMDTLVNFLMEEDELDLLKRKKTMLSKGHSLVVKRLLEYYPTALMEPDNMGRIPLCRAIQSMHCGADIVETLLREMEIVLKRQRRTKSGVAKLPSLLRMAIMGKLNPFQEADGIIKGKQSQNIISPMEELWKIVLAPRQILEPISSEINTGVASVSYIIESKLSPFERRVLIDKQAHHETQMREREAASLLAKQIGHIWEKAVHLIHASYRGTVQCIPDPMKKKGVTHAAAFCAVPRCIMNIVVRLYPDELTEEDANGDTPLSILLRHPKSCRSDLGWDTNDDVSEQDVNDIEAMNMLQTVLWANPSAAAVANRDGRLPLHLAIANGVQWSNGIQDIFLANPSAVSIRDPITRLFPFMHASVNDSDTQLDARMQEQAPTSEEELRAQLEPDHILTTAYELLRANPANLNT